MSSLLACGTFANLAGGKFNVGLAQLGYIDLRIACLRPCSFAHLPGYLQPVTALTVRLENGVVKSGYEDRKGKFYDSNLYRAIFLGEIPGFKLVYSTSGGEVKIFKIDE